MDIFGSEAEKSKVEIRRETFLNFMINNEIILLVKNSTTLPTSKFVGLTDK